jgi:hypothetical protein
MSADIRPEAGPLSRWLVYVILLGLYLTFRGYHSFDGDQTYRLPLLLHQQDPQLYAGDPFVRAFDAFNPHRGWLLVLDLATRSLGLPAGMFLVFVLTFAMTCAAIDRLARGTWPGLGLGVGLVAIGLFLAAKAGNIGTNHIFEAMVLDRQVAFALGWFALAQLVVRPDRGHSLVIAATAVATFIHPSAGLQLALVLAASWTAWWILGRWTAVSTRDVFRGCAGMAVAVAPGLALNLASGPGLLGDMPKQDFWLLSVELQGPQHMLPHLWRMPQWLACGSYFVLAALTLCSNVVGSAAAPDSTKRQTSVPFDSPQARVRLIVSFVMIGLGLSLAWNAIESLHLVRLTVFQPFRMATVARGIALVVVSGRIVGLWRTGEWLARMRAVLLSIAVTGDWLMVVITIAELAVSAAGAARARFTSHPLGRAIDTAVFVGALAMGLNFLGHHDTEYGHLPLLAAIGTGVLAGIPRFMRSLGRSLQIPLNWTPRRRRAILVFAWAIPIAAFLAAAIPVDWSIARSPVVRGLIGRCRFLAVPTDDVERLAIWCRDHTPVTARFIGPPGPKTFRLWSQRSLAFNRSASPYHAAGLSDWFARFQDHVGFHGPAKDFVQGYVADRHGFESRYDRLSDAERAALAVRQGAEYVVTQALRRTNGEGNAPESESPLELLHVEGRYAVYRLRSGQLAQRQR